MVHGFFSALKIQGHDCTRGFRGALHSPVGPAGLHSMTAPSQNHGLGEASDGCVDKKLGDLPEGLHNKDDSVLGSILVPYLRKLSHCLRYRDLRPTRPNNPHKASCFPDGQIPREFKASNYWLSKHKGSKHLISMYNHNTVHYNNYCPNPKQRVVG